MSHLSVFTKLVCGYLTDKDTKSCLMFYSFVLLLIHSTNSF